MAKTPKCPRCRKKIEYFQALQSWGCDACGWVERRKMAAKSAPGREMAMPRAMLEEVET